MNHVTDALSELLRESRAPKFSLKLCYWEVPLGQRLLKTFEKSETSFNYASFSKVKKNAAKDW